MSFTQVRTYQKKNRSLVLWLLYSSASSIQFILQQATINLSIEEFYSSTRFQSYLFSKLQVACENITEVSLTFLFQEVAHASVSGFQFRFFAQSFAILGIEAYHPSRFG